MRIIIAPAKQMKEDADAFLCDSLPQFLDRAKELRGYINGLSYDEQKKLWACSDKIAAENRERFAQMEPEKGLTPAILAYDGIQYTYMAPSVFEYGQFDYVQAHVRILSGFYGVLRPMDGVIPYRLEMQARVQVNGCNNLYDYWGDSLYRAVRPSDGVIVNLASKEYAKCIEKYLQPQDRFVTVVFGELSGGRVVQKGVYAKMARGEMVRYAAAVNAQTPEALKAFDRGYRFDEARSDDTKFVFIKTR